MSQHIDFTLFDLRLQVEAVVHSVTGLRFLRDIGIDVAEIIKTESRKAIRGGETRGYFYINNQRVRGIRVEWKSYPLWWSDHPKWYEAPFCGPVHFSRDKSLSWVG